MFIDWVALLALLSFLFLDGNVLLIGIVFALSKVHGVNLLVVQDIIICRLVRQGAYITRHFNVRCLLQCLVIETMIWLIFKVLERLDISLGRWISRIGSLLCLVFFSLPNVK